MRVLIFLIATLGFTASLSAQGCISNFTVEGTPLVTAMNFRSYQHFAKVTPASATHRLAQAMAAEGFSGIRVDRAMGTITAMQETSGSGRPQTFRVVARKSGAGTRVDAVFMIQVGQVANADVTRAAICRVISAAGE